MCLSQRLRDRATQQQPRTLKIPHCGDFLQQTGLFGCRGVHIWVLTNSSQAAMTGIQACISSPQILDANLLLAGFVPNLGFPIVRLNVSVIPRSWPNLAKLTLAKPTLANLCFNVLAKFSEPKKPKPQDPKPASTLHFWQCWCCCGCGCCGFGLPWTTLRQTT